MIGKRAGRGWRRVVLHGGSVVPWLGVVGHHGGGGAVGRGGITVRCVGGVSAVGVRELAVGRVGRKLVVGVRELVGGVLRKLVVLHEHGDAVFCRGDALVEHGYRLREHVLGGSMHYEQSVNKSHEDYCHTTTTTS